MAPSLGSKAAATTFASTASPQTTYPGTVNAGDVLTAAFVCDGVQVNFSGTPPSGWALVREMDQGTTRTGAVFRKIADGSETGTLTWTNIMSAASSGTAVMFTVVDSEDVTAGASPESTSTGTTKDTESATPPVADSLAVAVITHNQSRTFAWDATITEEYDSDTSPDGGNAPGFFIGSKLLSGTPATSLGGDASANCATTEFILFYEPAAAGGAVEGTAASTLPALTQDAAADALVDGPAASTLPTLTQDVAADLTVAGDAAATLPALTQSAEGTLTVEAAAASVLPTLDATASGTVEVDGVSGTAASTLPALAQEADGALGLGGTATSSLPALTADVAVDVTVLAATASALPALTATADGAVRVEATAASVLPALDAAATGSIVQDVSGDIAAVLPALTQDATARLGITIVQLALAAAARHELALDARVAYALTLTATPAYALDLGAEIQ